MRQGAFLEGKLAVVSGGSGGIGKAVTARLLGLGARVLTFGRDASALAGMRAELERRGSALTTVICDVSREDQVAKVFALADDMGGVDILVNNAGAASADSFVDTSVADFEKLVAVNAGGILLCGREAMRRMAGRGGRIVNIVSAAGLKGFPNEAAYCASKHAAMGLVKVMALEGHGDGIVVQTVCTTGVATEMIKTFRPDADARALIQPDDVADAVQFLLAQDRTAYSDVVTLRRADDLPHGF